MKVCFFGLENLPVLAPEYNQHGIGGEQVQHALLAKALVRRGYQVSMVVGDYGQPEGAVWNGVVTHKAYRFDAGLPVIRFVYPRWTGMWSALARADADIYYASCAGMHLGLMAMFCRRHSRKLVFRLASDTDAEPGHLLVRYWRDRKLYEYGLRRADAVLAQTTHQQATMRVTYGLETRVAQILVEWPNQRGCRAVARDLDVLWVNNLRPLKRPYLVLQIAKRLPNASIHMVGGPQPGYPDLYEEVRARAAALPNVVFHGRVPYHRVGELYDRAKVFINTSNTEGFPNSYLQCWVRGVPVVAFFDPDRLIRRELLGVAVSSVEDMTQAVGQLLNDSVQWRAVASRCRAYMEREYGEEQVLRPYLEVFEALYRSNARPEQCRTPA